MPEVMNQNAPAVGNQPANAGKQFAIPADLAKVINLRLSILIRLEKLEQNRRQIVKDDNNSRYVEMEAGRQHRELQRLPGCDIVNSSIENLKKKQAEAKAIYEYQQKNPQVIAGGEVKADEAVEEEAAEEMEEAVDQAQDDEPEEEQEQVKSNASPAVDSLDSFDFDDDDDLDDFDMEDVDEDDEEDEDELDEVEEDTNVLDPAAIAAKAAGDVIDDAYLQLLELGYEQAQLLIKRDMTTEVLLQVASNAGHNQRLYALLAEHGCDPVKVFGWTVYGLSLETIKKSTDEKLSAVQPGGSDDELSPRDEIQLLTNLKAAVLRERKAISKEMVNEFWRVYEQAAVILATKDFVGDDGISLRAFLRYGLLGDAPWLIGGDAYAAIMEQLADTVERLDANINATHVLYPDEYIHLAARGAITPSLDQDMELNEKGSDRWRADKLWRKVVYGQVGKVAMEQVVEGLKRQQEKRQEKSKKIEEKLLIFKKGRNRQNPKFVELQGKQQANNVMLARVTRAIDQIEQKSLVTLENTTKESKEKFEKIKDLMSAEVIARREAQGMRRMCKLCAKLKEPYLPTILRENFKLGTGAVNDRQAVFHELQEIEKCDPNVFREVLVPARKREHRTMIRHSPYVVLVPGKGMMGMSWNPRGGTEVGRLVLPAFNMRPGMLQKIIYDLIADFRFDTSKESAGVDLLTSDTLVAAYATARWNYRKRSKEIREKAGFFNDENDRTNWRRHYQLYITSAMDGGKKLFFKCSEVYDAVIKYMGLPAGVERLS